MMQKFRKYVSLYSPPVLWCGLIFYLSSQPYLRVSEGPWDLALRKFGHISEYFVLTILSSKAIGSSIFKLNKKTIISGALFSFFFAISDEYHQSFIEGRCGSPVDVGVDSIGIVLAGMGLWRFNVLPKLKSKEK